MSEENSELLFKWGTLKGWSKLEGKCLELLQEYFKEGVPYSCALDRPTKERKEVLIKLIDAFDGTLFNDWDNCEMTKEEAKKYVLEYGEK